MAELKTLDKIDGSTEKCLLVEESIRTLERGTWSLGGQHRGLQEAGVWKWGFFYKEFLKILVFVVCTPTLLPTHRDIPQDVSKTAFGVFWMLHWAETRREGRWVCVCVRERERERERLVDYFKELAHRIVEAWWTPNLQGKPTGWDPGEHSSLPKALYWQNSLFFQGGPSLFSWDLQLIGWGPATSGGGRSTLL